MMQLLISVGQSAYVNIALYLRKTVRSVNSSDPFNFFCSVVGALQVSSTDRSPFAKVWNTDILAELSELYPRTKISTIGQSCPTQV